MSVFVAESVLYQMHFNALLWTAGMNAAENHLFVIVSLLLLFLLNCCCCWRSVRMLNYYLFDLGCMFLWRVALFWGFLFLCMSISVCFVLCVVGLLLFRLRFALIARGLAVCFSCLVFIGYYGIIGWICSHANFKWNNICRAQFSASASATDARRTNWVSPNFFWPPRVEISG